MCPCKWLFEFFCKFSNNYAVTLSVFSYTYFPILCYVSFCTSCILAHTYMQFSVLCWGSFSVSAVWHQSSLYKSSSLLSLEKKGIARNSTNSSGKQEKESPKTLSRKNCGAPACTEPAPPLLGGWGGVWDTAGIAPMAVPHRRSSPDHKALSCHIQTPASKLRLAQLLDREYMGVAGLFSTIDMFWKTSRNCKVCKNLLSPMPFYAPCYFLCLCAKTQKIH